MRGRAAVLLLLGLFCCASAERLVKSALPLNVTDNLSEHLSCPVMTAAHSTGAPCPAAGHGTAHGSKPSDGGVAATLSPKDVGPSPLTQAVIISPPVNASTAQQHASAAQLTAQASWLPKLLMKAGIALLVALALHVLVSMRSRAAQLDLPKIPGPWKNGHWLLGNLMDLLTPDFHRTVLNWADKYGGVVRVRVLWFDGVVCTNPALLADVCGRGEKAMDKASAIYTPINQMCSPRGHSNLLTSAADPAWRAVRKAVAQAFSMQQIRKKYPIIRSCAEKLVCQLVTMSEEVGASAKTGNQSDTKSGTAVTAVTAAPITVDVDQAALRVTLDVIGLAGFGHDFGCLTLPGPMSDPAPRDHLLRVLPRCFTEVMLRLANPFRAFAPAWCHNGSKGMESFGAFQSEMRTLLRECLARPQPPPTSDVSIGAQLWRAYHEQYPPPPPLPATAALPQPSTNDTSSAPNTTTTATDADDETAGGLLPPRLTSSQALFYRLRDFWGQVRGTTSSLSSEAAGSGSKGGTKQAGGKAAAPLLSAERILSEIGILFVEGFETTGHTISWTLLNIATVPGVQERIAAELDANGLLAKPQAPGPFSSSTTPSQPENNNNKKSGMFHAIFGSSHTAPSSAETQAPTGSPDGFQNGCTKMSAPAVGQSGAAGNGAAVGVEGGSGSGVASWPLPRQLGMEDLQRLPYLTATIKEAMRVLPVVSVMSRMTGSKPQRLGPYLLPPHTPVAIPLFAIHNTQHNWDAPHEFRPERWLQVPVEAYVTGPLPPVSQASSKPSPTTNGSSEHHAHAPAGPECDTPKPLSPSPATATATTTTAGSQGSEEEDVDRSSSGASGAAAAKGTIAFMPFSEGPRNCVGQTMAKVEVAAVLATLLGAFRVELAPEMGGLEGVRSRESTHLTLQTRGTKGIRMVLHPRWV